MRQNPHAVRDLEGLFGNVGPGVVVDVEHIRAILRHHAIADWDSNMGCVPFGVDDELTF